MPKKTLEQYLRREVEQYHKENPKQKKGRIEVDYITEIRLIAVMNAVKDILIYINNKKDAKNNTKI